MQHLGLSTCWRLGKWWAPKAIYNAGMGRGGSQTTIRLSQFISDRQFGNISWKYQSHTNTSSQHCGCACHCKGHAKNYQRQKGTPINMSPGHRQYAPTRPQGRARIDARTPAPHAKAQCSMWPCTLSPPRKWHGHLHTSASKRKNTTGPRGRHNAAPPCVVVCCPNAARNTCQTERLAMQEGCLHKHATHTTIPDQPLYSFASMVQFPFGSAQESARVHRHPTGCRIPQIFCSQGRMRKKKGLGKENGRTHKA